MPTQIHKKGCDTTLDLRSNGPAGGNGNKPPATLQELALLILEAAGVDVDRLTITKGILREHEAQVLRLMEQVEMAGGGRVVSRFEGRIWKSEMR